MSRGRSVAGSAARGDGAQPAADRALGEVGRSPLGHGILLCSVRPLAWRADLAGVSRLPGRCLPVGIELLAAQGVYPGAVDVAPVGVLVPGGLPIPAL